LKCKWMECTGEPALIFFLHILYCIDMASCCFKNEAKQACKFLLYVTHCLRFILK
jgi:hypothetical protein